MVVGKAKDSIWSLSAVCWLPSLQAEKAAKIPPVSTLQIASMAFFWQNVSFSYFFSIFWSLSGRGLISLAGCWLFTIRRPCDTLRDWKTTAIEDWIGFGTQREPLNSSIDWNYGSEEWFKGLPVWSNKKCSWTQWRGKIGAKKLKLALAALLFLYLLYWARFVV